MRKIPFEFKTTLQPMSASTATNCWSDVDATTMKVRGPNYLEDKVKVSAPGAYTLLGVDMVKSDELSEHIVRRSDNPANVLLRACQARGEIAPFLFVVNFIMPWGHFIAYWSPLGAAKTPGSPYIGDVKFDRLMAAFLHGDEEYRNSRFKFVPRVVEGHWAVKKSVGEKPAMIGKKITHHYYKGDGYFEVDVDIQSSKIAKGILMMVQRYVKQVTIDLAFLFEGQAHEELPERLLGGLRFHCLDPDSAPKLPPAVFSPLTSPTAGASTPTATATTPLERKVSAS